MSISCEHVPAVGCCSLCAAGMSSFPHFISEWPYLMALQVTKADGSVEKLRAKNILIATGSYATRLPIEGAEHCITSDEALALDKLPDKSVLILGSG